MSAFSTDDSDYIDNKDEVDHHHENNKDSQVPNTIRRIHPTTEKTIMQLLAHANKGLHFHQFKYHSI